MTANDSSHRDEYDLCEIEIPPVRTSRGASRKIEERALSGRDLANLEKSTTIDNKNKNQMLARTLVVALTCFLATLSILSAAFIMFGAEGIKDFSNKVYTDTFEPLKYAFLLFIGFLFGDRTVGSK